MIPEYKYQIKDYSIITPPFKEYIVKPMIRFVPWWIPANIITILSNLCMYIALIIAVYGKSGQKSSYFLAALLIFMYALGDHLDGMQAKRTKTSSALGEFFDHYLDAFNTGVLLMISFALYGITNPYLVAFFLSVNYLAHASVFYEQFKTKWLIFEKIGSLEAVLISSGLLLLNCIGPVNAFLLSAPIFHLKIIELIFIVSTIGTIITFIKTLIRAGITEIKFYAFCISLIITTCLCVVYFSWINFSWIITLSGAFYIGNLMRGHLADGKERLPDFVIPALLLLAVLIQPLSTFQFGEILLSLLVIYVVYVAIATVYTLRRFWVWVNPKEKQ
jgi:phosphatidylglycerophosphate synthase